MAISVLLIGCGNMGYAMLSGWLHEDPALDVHVVEPFDDFRLRAQNVGAKAVNDISDLPDGLAPRLVVLAVKPQMIAPVLRECAAMANTATFLSVAAGVTIAGMAAALPANTAVIRCMPNMPAAIGEGMMALCAGPDVSAAAKAHAESLMASSGPTVWIEDESLMDAVTAISGSGPAYIFHFIEALTEAGIALGLPSQTAEILAQQTVAGAALYARRSNVGPGVLREQVTSPNGTTAAALDVFMTDNRLGSLVADATRAARDRGIELGKGA